MANFHTTSIAIKHGVETQGYFSFATPQTLIVFVHGFGGNAITTWNNFPSLILEDPDFKRADIIFYGYDTLGGRAGDHAAELYDFLKKLVKPLAAKILPARQKLPERTYKKIVLVAHSLGAIIARQTLLLAHDAKDAWVKSCNLALFAPAHQGASIVSLAFKALPGLWTIVGLVAKYKYPVLDDLDPDSDGIIKSVREQTIALQSNNKGDFTKAKLVVYAKGDKIVKNIPYPGDTAPKVVKSHDHMSVCKPKDLYLLPLIELKKI
ncbi:MAG: esterase/lipase family protein [Bacteroidota bacterium]|jgi:pimeloyl-ACP methyl ester carboxylesterase|nr:alpha/beta fold hydrolase [Cytophagales bacterium]MCE2956733.1 alpha/beta hydrolase [Flammeovirgaceae bacterium]MCZ8069651.1 alpha/beta fold hydrolase [Cytophagales bacterium]